MSAAAQVPSTAQLTLLEVTTPHLIDMILGLGGGEPPLREEVLRGLEPTSSTCFFGEHSNLTTSQPSTTPCETTATEPPSKRRKLHKDQSSSGPSSSTRFNSASTTTSAFSQRLRIGRSKECEIRVVDDVYVSKQHCEVEWKQIYHTNYFSVRELGSLHGTFVFSPSSTPIGAPATFHRLSEARQISKGWSLKDGDIILTGRTLFRFDYVHQPPPPSTPPPLSPPSGDSPPPSPHFASYQKLSAVRVVKKLRFR